MPNTVFVCVQENVDRVHAIETGELSFRVAMALFYFWYINHTGSTTSSSSYIATVWLFVAISSVIPVRFNSHSCSALGSNSKFHCTSSMILSHCTIWLAFPFKAYGQDARSAYRLETSRESKWKRSLLQAKDVKASKSFFTHWKSTCQHSVAGCSMFCLWVLGLFTRDEAWYILAKEMSDVFYL